MTSKTTPEQRAALRALCEDDDRKASPLLTSSRRSDKVFKPLVLGLLDDLEAAEKTIVELQILLGQQIHNAKEATS